MIYLNILGRMGNQMFEYAYARKIQLITGQDIVFNVNHLKRTTKFDLELDLFDLKGKYTVENKKKFLLKADTSFFLTRFLYKFFKKKYPKYLLKKGIILNLSRVYSEPQNYNFPDIYLNGFFQCPKYFDDIIDELRSEFVPKVACDSNNDLYNKIINTESVCISIRRGDYISNDKFKKRFYICDEDYFEKGLDIISKKIKKPVLFIFSDDIEWAKSNIHYNYETYFESGKDNVAEKMRLMSSCKHFIISNSSFSWWAQYLSTNPNKVVVAPSRWYNIGEKPMLYMDDWILVEK